MCDDMSRKCGWATLDNLIRCDGDDWQQDECYIGRCVLEMTWSPSKSYTQYLYPWPIASQGPLYLPTVLPVSLIGATRVLLLLPCWTNSPSLLTVGAKSWERVLACTLCIDCWLSQLRILFDWWLGSYRQWSYCWLVLVSYLLRWFSRGSFQALLAVTSKT